MAYRVEIYIGSDDHSRTIPESYLTKIRAWADTTFPYGYTLLKGPGSYNGIQEESLLINTISENQYSLKLQLELASYKREEENEQADHD